MQSLHNLALGIDLGTSGVRIAIIDNSENCLYTASMDYPTGLSESHEWKDCCIQLISSSPSSLKKGLSACAIDGTSGTLVACNDKGIAFGDAIPYNVSCSKHQEKINRIFPNNKLSNKIFSSIEKGFELTERYGEKILLRHQADWVNGWLLNNWEWGEEGNNLKFGWDNKSKSWPKSFHKLPWFRSLPRIVPSGQKLGLISEENAILLGVPRNLNIISGTTDSNAALLAIDPKEKDGITVLGSTIVIKKIHKESIQGDGISNHYLMGKWICGGASNAGCSVLKEYFNDQQLKELSTQINPRKSSGLNYRPLSGIGERFPIYDPKMEAILKPRPISDSLFLHGMLEGLAKIEAEGWQKFYALGIPLPKRIISIGGGAKNIQWQKIRERIIGIPMRSNKKPPAVGVAKIALKVIQDQK